MPRLDCNLNIVAKISPLLSSCKNNDIIKHATTVAYNEHVLITAYAVFLSIFKRLMITKNYNWCQK